MMALIRACDEIHIRNKKTLAGNVMLGHEQVRVQRVTRTRSPNSVYLQNLSVPARALCNVM
jgi:hypothetical protein